MPIFYNVFSVNVEKSLPQSVESLQKNILSNINFIIFKYFLFLRTISEKLTEPNLHAHFVLIQFARFVVAKESACIHVHTL
jgi:hypothetical protein